MGGNENRAPAERGIFITFEGGEGVGKSTQIAFLTQRLEDAGYTVLHLREPGGTAIGEAIRKVLLDPANASMAAETELLLYEAARAQLMEEVIEPALARGEVVLCDRFTDSTIAYQGVARDLGVDLVRRFNSFACKGVAPDRTIVLQYDVETALARASQHGADRIEQEGLLFHRRVNEGFEAIAAAEPERVRLVKTCEFKEATARAVFDELKDLFPAGVLR